MDFKFPVSATDQDILRCQLKKKTSVSPFLFIPALLILLNAGNLLNYFSREGSSVFREEGVLFFLSALLFLQIIFLFALCIWRAIRPESNEQAAKKCFRFNICICCFSWLIPLAAFCAGKIDAGFSSLFPCTFFLWQIGLINRTITLLYKKPDSLKTKEAVSPCAEVFAALDMSKSLFFAPFLLMVVLAMIFIFGTQEPFSEVLLMACAGGGMTSIFFWPIAFSACLIKQDSHPSFGQQVSRAIVFYCLSRKPSQQLTAFRWWLSHPKQDWPHDAELLFSLIDTSKFDWQNPAKWPMEEELLEQAFTEPVNAEIWQDINKHPFDK